MTDDWLDDTEQWLEDEQLEGRAEPWKTFSDFVIMIIGQRRFDTSSSLIVTTIGRKSLLLKLGNRRGTVTTTVSAVNVVLRGNTIPQDRL